MLIFCSHVLFSDACVLSLSVCSAPVPTTLAASAAAGAVGRDAEESSRPPDRASAAVVAHEPASDARRPHIRADGDGLRRAQCVHAGSRIRRQDRAGANHLVRALVRTAVRRVKVRVRVCVGDLSLVARSKGHA